MGTEKSKYVYMLNMKHNFEGGIRVLKCNSFNCCETDTELVIGYHLNDMPHLVKVKKQWFFSPMVSLIESGCIFSTTEKGVLDILGYIQDEIESMKNIVKGDLK